MPANAVEGAARALRGAVKRWYNHANATLTSGGSANVHTLTYGTAPSAYVSGDGYVFKAGFTNSGATTLNVNGLGAKAVQSQGAALVGNEIVSGLVAVVYYDGVNFQLVNSQSGNFAGAVTVTQSDAATPAIRVNMPTGTVNSEGALRVSGWSPSVELINKDNTLNWYFGINDDDAKALYIGEGYGPHQGIAPALKITAANVVSLANALPIASGGSGATSASAAFAALAVAASSIANPGFIEFQNGLIFQWGTQAFVFTTSVAVTFPHAFPTAVFVVIATPMMDPSGNQTCGVKDQTTTGFNLNVGQATSNSQFWFAVGN